MDRRRLFPCDFVMGFFGKISSNLINSQNAVFIFVHFLNLSYSRENFTLLYLFFFGENNSVRDDTICQSAHLLLDS